MSYRRISLDGRLFRVRDALSSGPGEPIHTYVISYYGSEGTVMRFGAEWFLTSGRCDRRQVEVSDAV